MTQTIHRKRRETGHKYNVDTQHDRRIFIQSETRDRAENREKKGKNKKLN